MASKITTGGETTQQRILAAAARRFEAASYEAVGLREIAADVGVDVAYVHRSFGSKEKLFWAVLEAQDVPAGLTGDRGSEGLMAALREMLVTRPYAAEDRIDPLLLLIRSLASPVASPLLAERLEREIIGPMSRRLPAPAQFRATAVMALLIGLSISKNLLNLPGMPEPAEPEFETLIARAITVLMGEDRLSDPEAEV